MIVHDVRVLERAGGIAAAESLARRHSDLRADERRGREHEGGDEGAHDYRDDTVGSVGRPQAQCLGWCLAPAAGVIGLTIRCALKTP